MITLGPLPEGPLGVAVSGGGDSIALLMLLYRAGHRVKAATVDHRLRPEAADEAAGVATLCAEYGISHTTLVWEHAKIKGNLQAAAREARRGLLADWARAEGLQDIALGHTLDDQAETVLMRMARGSGVDGLAGMATKRCADGLCWHRPLLAINRSELRAYLREIGVVWAEDPSNDDTRYDRIKARRALSALEPLGLDAARLAETAAHMRRARAALEASTKALAQRCATLTAAGELRLALTSFATAPREIQLRLLSAALGWVASAGYRPRFNALEALLDASLNNADLGKTLHGCAVFRQKNEIVINRAGGATMGRALGN